MSGFIDQADVLKQVDEKGESHDRTIGVSSSVKDDCSDLTDVNNQDNEDGESFPKTFPRRLMDILTNEQYSHIISWLPQGNGFMILKKKAFASEILPKYFRGTKFTSFTRKLNRWGFSRVPRGPETGSYYHKLFQRDKPELCLQMTSQSGNKYQSNPMQQNILPNNNQAMQYAPMYMMNPMQMTPQQQQAWQVQMWQMQQAWMQQQQQQMMQNMPQPAPLPNNTGKEEESATNDDDDLGQSQLLMPGNEADV